MADDRRGERCPVLEHRDRRAAAHNAVIIRATPTSAREVVLVRAYTGLYRCVTAADGRAARWEKIGRLPHAVVQSLRYRPPHATHPGDDVLVVGLQGRGTWVLPDASVHL